MIKISIAFFLMTTFLFSTELTHQKCLDNAGSTGAAIRDCNEQELIYQDKLLNKFYKQAMNNLSDDQNEKKNLKLAQRAWIKFRDLDCKSRSYPMGGGTGEYTLFQACMMELTVERVKTLKNEY